MLVFSLGFISILAFGGILATAGEITNAVADDLLLRLRLKFMTKPCVACLTWGGLYYSWMALTASVTRQWKLHRLGETASQFTFSDAYWFSYISSTSIGFGDIFLEPEVLLAQDLITFPLLFLVSFVFVAAFLGKFSDSVGAVCGRKTLVRELTDRLKQTDLYFDAAEVNLENPLSNVHLLRKRKSTQRNSIVVVTNANNEQGEVQSEPSPLADSSFSSIYFDAPKDVRTQEAPAVEQET